MTLTIYDAQGGEVITVTPDDTSYRHREVMGDDDLTLKFSLARHVEIPVGSTVEFMGDTYTLARPEALTMHHTRDYEYTATFEGAQWRAGVWKFRDLTDGRVKFSLTAGPAEHLDLLVRNLNAREAELDPGRFAELDGVWVAGECVEGDEVCIGYDRVFCSEALALMADAFGTEYEWGKEYLSHVDRETGETTEVWTGRRTVSLRKVEYGRDDPLEMSYGKGNGFRPDVGRGNSSDDPPVERLFAQGGSDNIDASKYPQELHRGVDPDDPDNPDNIDPKTGEPYPGDGTGNSQITHSSELLLPPGRVIGYDGEGFYYDYDPDAIPLGDVRWYEVDAEGFSISRVSDGEEEGYRMLAEDSLDCTEIYPKRVGTVGKVVEAGTVTDDDGNESMLYDFTDPDIDFDYNKYMIGEGPLTVIFQSGELAGKEFDVTYVHEAVGGKEARRFEVVQQEIDGVLMPDGGAFGIQTGDRYAVFGCMLPDEYICHDSDHSGAEWDMLRECAEYMYGREQENHTITGKMDGIWSRENWDEVGPKVRPGQFVLFSDTNFQEEPLLIRITGVKDYLNSPQSPELELSNETAVRGLLGKVGSLRSDILLMDDRQQEVDRRRARGDWALSLIDDRLIDEIADVGDEVDGVTGRVGDLEDTLYGTADTVGAMANIEALQEAVESLNKAVNKLDSSFTGDPTTGGTGRYDPGTGKIG